MHMIENGNSIPNNKLITNEWDNHKSFLSLRILYQLTKLILKHTVNQVMIHSPTIHLIDTLLFVER
jgi:hypothetical protein